MSEKPDVVDTCEVARRLEVRPNTVRVWRYRNVMPQPDWDISGMPAWLWSTVERWARDTHRLDTPA